MFGESESDPEQVEELPEVRSEVPPAVESELIANIEGMERKIDVVPAEQYEVTIEPKKVEELEVPITASFAPLVDDQYQDVTTS